jgi:hypothetical protein
MFELQRGPSIPGYPEREIVSVQEIESMDRNSKDEDPCS